MRLKKIVGVALVAALCLAVGCRTTTTARATLDPFERDAEIAVELTLASY